MAHTEIKQYCSNCRHHFFSGKISDEERYFHKYCLHPLKPHIVKDITLECEYWQIERWRAE